MSDQPGTVLTSCHHFPLIPGPGPSSSSLVGRLACAGASSSISFCLPDTHRLLDFDLLLHVPTCSTPETEMAMHPALLPGPASNLGGHSCYSLSSPGIRPLLGPAKLLPSFQPWAYHCSFLNHLKPPHHLCIVNTWCQIVTVVTFEEKRKGSCIKVALSVWKSSVKLTWLLDTSPLCME